MAEDILISTPSLGLLGRLRFRGYLNSDNGDYGLRNPDGPAASDEIERLLAVIETEGQDAKQGLVPKE